MDRNNESDNTEFTIIQTTDIDMSFTFRSFYVFIRLIREQVEYMLKHRKIVYPVASFTWLCRFFSGVAFARVA